MSYNAKSKGEKGVSASSWQDARCCNHPSTGLLELANIWRRAKDLLVKAMHCCFGVLQYKGLQMDCNKRIVFQKQSGKRLLCFKSIDTILRHGFDWVGISSLPTHFVLPSVTAANELWRSYTFSRTLALSAAGSLFPESRKSPNHALHMVTSLLICYSMFIVLYCLLEQWFTK